VAIEKRVPSKLTGLAVGWIAALTTLWSQSAIAQRRAAHDATTAPSAPSSRAAIRTLNVVGHIQSTLRTARYEHTIDVDERTGRYVFDCSGMTAWILARSAPSAHRAVMEHVHGFHPLARDYYRQIAAVAPGAEAHGWHHVARVSDAQPGDVVAWLRPAIVRSNNTGHVAIIVSPPARIEGTEQWLVRIADASRYQHQDDSREGSGRTGFGFGTILVRADPATGAPVAYGWFGAQSAWVLATSMAIGRPTR